MVRIKINSYLKGRRKQKLFFITNYVRTKIDHILNTACVGYIDKKRARVYRHSSALLAVPTILLPRVQVPSTPIGMLLPFIVKFVLYLFCKKNEDKQKRPGLAHFFKKEKREDK